MLEENLGKPMCFDKYVIISSVYSMTFNGAFPVGFFF